MEVLATELAKVLNITIEKAIELYPLLKQQFINFNILYAIGSIFIVGIFISVIGLLMIAIISIIEELKWCKIRKPLILFGSILITSVLGNVVLGVLQYVLAPDFMIIKELIIK